MTPLKRWVEALTYQSPNKKKGRRREGCLAQNTQPMGPRGSLRGKEEGDETKSSIRAPTIDIENS